MLENNINKNPITNAFRVSNSIVKFFHDLFSEKKEQKKIDVLRTLKLIYICFGVISTLKKQYLFSERIEAWKLGPVVPDVYDLLRDVRNPKNFLLESKESYSIKNEKEVEDSEITKIIHNICNVYKEVSITNLVNLTHIKGSPWYESYTGLPNVEIPKNLIVKYYENFILNLK